MKNCKKDKNYKLSIYKYNQSVTGDITNYWIEKFNIDNISERDNIDKLNLENFKNLKETSFYDGLGSRRDVGYEANDPENIDILGGSIQSGGSIKIIQNTRFIVKLSECQLFFAGDSLEINEIPDIFFKKRNLVIMKNLNDNKCLLYCYIQKYLNPITVNLSRISKKDMQISKELIDEFNVDFENISMGEIDEIENFLECNIHIFEYNKEFNSKKNIQKPSKPISNIKPHLSKALQTLRQKKTTLKITKADKGNATVIMSQDQYIVTNWTIPSTGTIQPYSLLPRTGPNLTY